jgi:protein-disulfide isomerase
MKSTMSRASAYAAILLVMAWNCSAQDVAQITAAGQHQMLSDPGSAILGAAHPDITVVEYLDYNCSFCRKLAPVFGMLVGSDPHVAVLYKDWPIFGGVSVYAAKAALAAQWQGKYLAAHDALIGAPRLAENAQVDAALAKAGIDMARLKKDLDVHGGAINELLARNQLEANALNLRGTPGLVVGRYVISNPGDLAGLESAVAHARSAR